MSREKREGGRRTRPEPVVVHPGASELVAEEQLKGEARTRAAEQVPRESVMRRSTRTVVTVLAGAVILSATVVALFFRRPGLAIVGTITFALYSMILLLPVLLARVLKLFQDHDHGRDPPRG